MSVTLLVVNVEGKETDWSFSHPMNMPLTSVSSGVLKLEMFSVCRFKQLKNMPLIVVTFAVLKLVKIVKSSEVRLEHPPNVWNILVTFSVLRYSILSMLTNFPSSSNLVRFVMPKNHLYIVVGL